MSFGIRSIQSNTVVGGTRNAGERTLWKGLGSKLCQLLTRANQERISCLVVVQTGKESCRWLCYKVYGLNLGGVAVVQVCRMTDAVARRVSAVNLRLEQNTHSHESGWFSSSRIHWYRKNMLLDACWSCWDWKLESSTNARKDWVRCKAGRWEGLRQRRKKKEKASTAAWHTSSQSLTSSKGLMLF